MNLKKQLVKSTLNLIFEDLKEKIPSEEANKIVLGDILIVYYLDIGQNKKNPFAQANFKLRVKVEQNEKFVIAFYYRNYKYPFDKNNIDTYLNDNEDSNIRFSSNGKYEMINDNIKHANEESFTQLLKKKRLYSYY